MSAAVTGSTDTSHSALRAWGGWLVAVAFVVYYFSFQTGYAITNASVQRDIVLTLPQVASVAAVYTWVFAACQFLSGPLLDRLGARRVLLPAIALVTAGILLFANSGSFGMLLVSQALIAIGACTGFVGAGYIGGQWFGMAKFSFMFGLVQFSASLFSAFNQNLLAWALAQMPWRTLFDVIGVLGVVLLGAAVLWLRDAPGAAPPARTSAGEFLHGVGASLLAVIRIPHVWAASAFGALAFGAMLSLGIVWAPKLMLIRGLPDSMASLSSSLLWLGLATGCFIVPWLSDRWRRRKLPTIAGLLLQTASLAALLYIPGGGAGAAMFACFLFGFGNAAHMLAFSTAADVVEPRHIGTSAAVVNGCMFIVGGLLISRPGLRAGTGIEAGLERASLELAQYAARPLLLGLCVALVIALLMRETYPRATLAS